MNLLPVIFLQSLTYTLGTHAQNSILPETPNMDGESLNNGMGRMKEIVGIYKGCLSNNEGAENDHKLDKDDLISAHWGSTTKSPGFPETTKEDCLHKYKTFMFTEATTHWPTMKPPQTATYRIVNPNPYCKHYHTVEKTKKSGSKDIPLDLPIIIHSRN